MRLEGSCQAARTSRSFASEKREPPTCTTSRAVLAVIGRSPREILWARLYEMPSFSAAFGIPPAHLMNRLNSSMPKTVHYVGFQCKP